MSTRIATPYMFTQGVDAMLNKQAELTRTELQLAEGKRILRPSDDAAATAQLIDLKEHKAKIDQYQRNADAVYARLGQEETALEGIGNLLQRVRELTVQGNNGALGAEQRAAVATELRQHVKNFVQLANTRDANDEYIFSGYRTDTEAISYTPPAAAGTSGSFTYNGDANQRMVKIGDSREVAMGDPGSVFMNIPASGGGAATSVGAIIDQIAADFEAGNSAPNGLTDLDSAIDRIATTRASVGGRMNAIDDQRVMNESFTLAVEQVRSSLEDLDYSEAISRFNQQLTALQASQQSFLKIQDLNLFNFLR